MKKIKIILILILVSALSLIIIENWSFFSTKHSISVFFKFNAFDKFINLFDYELPAIANGLYLLGCFLVGYLVASFSGLMTKFKANKIVKNLNSTVASQQEKLSSLRSEVEFLQRNSARPSPKQENESAEPEKELVQE